MKKPLAVLGLAFVAIGALALSGCGGSSTKTMTMVLTQPAPLHNIANFGQAAGEIGNLHTFQAPLSENNVLVGQLTGERILTQTSENIAWAIEQQVPGAEGIDLPNAAVWHQSMTFHLKGRGTIQVGGNRVLLSSTDASLIPLMAIAARQPLAITGGTGEFMFARGEVTSVRNDDGSYSQTFTYRLS